MITIVLLTAPLISKSVLSDVFAAKARPINVRSWCTGYGKDPEHDPAKRIACCKELTYSDDMEMTYCHGCDSTNPPTNCNPWSPAKGGSKGIYPNKINEGGTYSTNNSGASKGIDSNKINSGIGFK